MTHLPPYDGTVFLSPLPSLSLSPVARKPALAIASAMLRPTPPYLQVQRQS